MSVSCSLTPAFEGPTRTKLMARVLAELSLTVPIVNTLAFLFTVIGEWWVEKKVISRGKANARSLLHSGG